jgi:hypothetical protein
MTISSTITKNSYSGNGSTTAFAFAYYIISENDVEVIIRSSNGTETVQSLTTHYTVTGVQNNSGGTVTMVTAPATGETLVIRRATSKIQDTDYVANDPFPAETHEAALDKGVLISQELQEQVNRSIKISRTNTMTSTDFTVGASERANKVLAFDSSGEISVTQELGRYRGDWSASTSYAIRDLIKDTSTNNIFFCNTAHTSSGTEPLTTNTDSSKWDLIVDAASATTSATAAASSASAASSSATSAASSATAASTSESNASTSETNAATSETNAATSATNSFNSATASATSATNAATSETNASTSATTASTQASNASSSATAAASSASAAATSETNSSTSATTATTQASSASTSATNASNSASAASTSATNASNAQTAAEAAQAAAEAAADNFDDTYLGAKASDPTVDNDGDALNAGDLYFNTTSSVLKYYDGSAWQNVESTDVSAYATKGFAIAMGVAL